MKTALSFARVLLVEIKTVVLEAKATGEYRADEIQRAYNHLAGAEELIRRAMVFRAIDADKGKQNGNESKQ